LLEATRHCGARDSDDLCSRFAGPEEEEEEEEELARCWCFW
jgi:hypothetical protein